MNIKHQKSTYLIYYVPHISNVLSFCITCLVIPSRYYTSLIFGLMGKFGCLFFYLFGPSVINSVIQFSIYLVLWIQSNVPARIPILSTIFFWNSDQILTKFLVFKYVRPIFQMVCLSKIRPEIWNSLTFRKKMIDLRLSLISCSVFGSQVVYMLQKVRQEKKQSGT